ncbi:DUF1062 domain-containing protein [Streptomyces sp. NPDC005776]|uniref:DUF1062 domain-containing protein n=3 Tax=unclassified Streptomyces TaxID=2593676 RepID=UPI0033CBA675
MLKTWVVTPTCLPLVVRRCHVCASDRFRTDGKFRVNAHHKLLDAWLLALCTACGGTTKLTVLERTQVRSIPAESLNRMHDNDASLAARLLQEPGVRRRNRIALDWDNAWRLDTAGSDHVDDEHRDGAANDAANGDEVLDVTVRFAARIPVRPVRLIAEGCGLPRAEVERLAAAGKLISAVRLSGRLSGDFAFLLKR